MSRESLEVASGVRVVGGLLACVWSDWPTLRWPREMAKSEATMAGAGIRGYDPYI